MQLTLPTMVGSIISFTNEVANVIFIGHAGDEVELAAVGIGNMMQNCVGLSIGIGFSLALNTFVSQASGAGRPDLCAVYLQRCRLLCTMQLIWMIPLLWFSEQILLAIGQDAGVAFHAGNYNKITSIGLFFYFQSNALQTFLRNLNYVNIPTVFTVITSALHLVWCWLYIWHLKLGNTGAGLANVTTWALQAASFGTYAVYLAPMLGVSRWAVLGFQKEGFRGWARYVEMAGPMVFQLCAEWWFWEILCLVVGYLGTIALAAHVSASNVIVILFMIPLAIKTASSTLVGQRLGAGKPKEAYYMCWLSISMNGVVCICIAALLVVGRYPLARAYTSTTNVCSIMEGLFCIYALAGIFDSTQTVMGGILCGMGWPQTVSIVYIGAFYVISIPVGLAFAFPMGYGVNGLWFAMVPGTFIATIIFWCILHRMNWDTVSNEVAARIQREDDCGTNLESFAVTP